MEKARSEASARCFTSGWTTLTRTTRERKAAGATIVLELANQPWGDRRYQASDPKGHQWSFAQHIFDADPDVCAGESRHY
ncbi:MAG: VOC family protein [Vulcanimicrobiaceae bacterium]